MSRYDKIHEAVCVRAAERPGAPAIIHADRIVPYADVDRWSDDLAEAMAEAGVGPGTIVPVLLPPSPLLVVVLLAVLKRGAAYAALDVAWPTERVRRILDVLHGQLAVTGDAGLLAAGRRLVVNDDLRVVLDATSRPPRIVEADGSPAMVFFTSGSTGEPKAVLSPHRATTRLFDSCTFGCFNPTTVMTQAAAVPWDAFALELWGPLTTGGTCVLVSERPLTPDGLRHAVTAYGVTTVFLTTSLFHLFVEEDVASFKGLGTVIVGGERMSAAHARDLLAAVPNLRLVNGYGPVESAVFALTHDVRPQDSDTEIPLGRPVSHTEVVVMRPDDRPAHVCADGEIGEICIAGDGLAIGYLGDAALTAEKFPTVRVAGAPVRIYRTGDLGRRTADGVIHFHGRRDRQVKLRGNRVEPAGAERVAMSVPGVRRCVVVVARDDTGNATGLRMFYLPTGGCPSVPELAAALRATLPAYAVPDRIVALERFPLSANGKVDVDALLAADGDPDPQGSSVGAPHAETGNTAGIVAAEVAALLGLTDVDPAASMFALGATSMTAVRLCTRLSRRFERIVPISRLMAAPTVDDLAAWLDSPDSIAASRPIGDGLAQAGPVTPMQQSFVLQELRARHGEPTNLCVLRWTITGALDPARLAAAVQAVHLCHESLRVRFDIGDDVVARVCEAPATVVRLSADDPETAERLMADGLRRPFDLTTGPVWRAVLVHDLHRRRWEFGVSVHHAVVDGWSEHLLSRDLSDAYDRRRTRPAPSLGEVRRSLETIARAVDLPAQRAYWAAAVEGLPPVAWPVPADPHDACPRWVDYPLDAELMAGVVDAARRWGTTTLAVLLDAVGRGLFAHTAVDDVGIGVPVSTRGTDLLQRPVGCLVDTVCVRLRRTGHGLATLAPVIADAMAHADLPFAEVVRVARPARTGRHPLYQVIAAVQDSPAPVLHLTGSRTERHRKDDLPWADIELVVELFCAAGEPPYLRLTRDPKVVERATFTAIAGDVLDALRTCAEEATSRRMT